MKEEPVTYSSQFAVLLEQQMREALLAKGIDDDVPNLARAFAAWQVLLQHDPFTSPEYVVRALWFPPGKD